MTRGPSLPAYSAQYIPNTEGTSTSSGLPRPGSTVIIVMGQTGSGKSTFIKTATGNENIVVGHELKSCTKGVMWYQIPNTDVFLVDTPGFDDTYNDDLSILRTIAQMLEDFFDHDVHTRGVIYMHDILEARMKRSALKNMRMFEQIVGPSKMASCCLVMSKWGQQDTAKSIRNEAELVATRNFWGLLCSRGAGVARFMDTPDSAAAIWGPMSKKGSFTNQITEEFSIDDQPLANTSAGRLVDQNLEEVAKEHAEEIAQLREDATRAFKQRDRDLALEYDNERHRLELELEKLRKDQTILEQERKEETRARRNRRRNRKGRWIARTTGLLFTMSLPVSGPALLLAAATLGGVEAICQLQKTCEDDDYGNRGFSQ